MGLGKLVKELLCIIHEVRRIFPAALGETHTDEYAVWCDQVVVLVDLCWNLIRSLKLNLYMSTKNNPQFKLNQFYWFADMNHTCTVQWSELHMELLWTCLLIHLNDSLTFICSNYDIMKFIFLFVYFSMMMFNVILTIF